jgi:heme exporter protein A
MVQLRAAGLAKRFGRRDLFRGLDLLAGGGEVVAVTGRNGSGKSTLLRILAGVLTPNRGEVNLEVDGRAISPEDRPLHVGLVAPYLNVYDPLTALENLIFVANVQRLPDAPLRADEVLDAMGLSDRKNDRVETFSSGMKQRVKLAVALITRPPLLLLDEPSSNLDADGLLIVDRAVSRARAAGAVVILATNDEREALRCDRVLRIEDYA